MTTGQSVRGGSQRVNTGASDPQADAARAAQARAVLAEGGTRKKAAARVGLSAMGLSYLLDRVAKREAAQAAAVSKVLETEGGHLMGSPLPPALSPVERSEAEERQWQPRLIFVARLHDMADAFAGPVAAGLRHLADLHEHHPTFYPDVNIREGDGLPWRGPPAEPRGLIGSSALACSEG